MKVTTHPTDTDAPLIVERSADQRAERRIRFLLWLGAIVGGSIILVLAQGGLA